jgi:ABC-type phosphate transport system substrate-binding protein
MATAIFSGGVTDWSDFGLNSAAGFVNGATQPIVVCMRHAGSGTHATLDAAVMRGDAFLLKDEHLPTDPLVLAGVFPITYFNKGSSDMMKCIRDCGDGAIGYADSDKNGENPDGSEGDYPTVKRLEYMGEDGIALNVINGIYDFWSAQWLYFRSDEDPAVKAKILELCDYAADPNNMPDSRRAFWTTQDELKVDKSDDFDWPNWK